MKIFAREDIDTEYKFRIYPYFIFEKNTKSETKIRECHCFTDSQVKHICVPGILITVQILHTHSSSSSLLS